ncbi:MAG: antibiotic biosynthesis monooxygenase [SAR324 cluster bacterium]|nr:antibiotic biosynthesis monooxygenase [SAR324 cluster bacterium]
MYAVIFEVEPKPEHHETYLNMAAELKKELEKIDGFISVERYASLSNEGKMVSLSFWESEEAVVRWRRHHLHRDAQEKGRQSLFDDYRIRVAKIERDYSLKNREQAP